MKPNRWLPKSLTFIVVLGLGVALSVLMVGCNLLETAPYLETFDDPGDWATGDDTYSSGQVVDGKYDFLVKSADRLRYVSANEEFSDGIYEVETVLVDGPVDNGYGMIFRADPQNGDFYLFEISSDGFVWIGRYRDGIEEQPIVGQHWFESAAIRQGRNVTNKLGVWAEAGNLIFSINDVEVGRITDNSFDSGDIGLFVQTFGEGGVRVQFDNFTVNPLSD